MGNNSGPNGKEINDHLKKTIQGGKHKSEEKKKRRDGFEVVTLADRKESTGLQKGTIC